MIEILYEDDNLCIINKASGSVVHKTRGAGDSPVILQALRDQMGKKIFPVHRLDRGTSGCLAFAFSSEVAAGLQASLQSGRKKYQTLCRGQLPSEGVIERELSNEKKIKQNAVTKYKSRMYFHEPCHNWSFTLAELELVTGRRHQIRRHLAYLGHQILGDVNYGKGWINRPFREKYNFHRMFLHCTELCIAHPKTDQLLEIKCPMSEELTGLLAALKEN